MFSTLPLQTSAAQSDSLVAVKEAFPTIFKENMALQLEATYRYDFRQFPLSLLFYAYVIINNDHVAERTCKLLPPR